MLQKIVSGADTLYLLRNKKDLENLYAETYVPKGLRVTFRSIRFDYPCLISVYEMWGWDDITWGFFIVSRDAAKLLLDAEQEKK